MNSMFKKVAVGAGAVAVAGSAMAESTGVDVSSVVSTINGGLAAIGAIGVAILGIAAVVAIYNWVKRPIK
ncbi:major capsid protein [Ralstonia mannitolilytica]|uniref:major capsid protein n=1 Tax=Ralstonia mannitolilytica TaxID=105219 RepID=UPI00374881FD